jgi:AcrR family transcriptional regulator
VTELAESVGLSHPNLIYYFGDKKRLLREAVEEREHREDWFYGNDIEKLSLSTLPDAARVLMKNSLFARLYVVLAAESLDTDADLHDFFTLRYERARQWIQKALASDQEHGRIRSDIDLVQVSFEVLSTVMGLEIQWLMDPDHVDYMRIVDRYTAGLFERYGPAVAATGRGSPVRAKTSSIVAPRKAARSPSGSRSRESP